MDTITQGLLGATAAQLVLGHRLGHRAWIAGMAGGMLPDADVFLQPWADPALPWSLHRHFTHGLVMAPVIGLVAGLVLLLCSKRMRAAGWALVIVAAIAGALTHAPLDWCTSYGTKILWPFSLTNWTIDLYPIVDPLFTLVLLVCVVIAARRRSRGGAVAAVVFLALYTGLALHQRARAFDAQAAIATSRGQVPRFVRVMPMPGSLLVWRSLYDVNDVLYTDAIRSVPGSAVQWKSGESAPVARVSEGVALWPQSKSSARLLEVWSRFEHFAQGWISWDPRDPRLLSDARMSSGVGFQPIWGIRIGEDGTLTWTMPDRGEGRVRALWELMWGRTEGLQELKGASGGN